MSDTSCCVDLPSNPGDRESLEKLLWKMIELDGSDLFLMGNQPVRCRVGSKFVPLTRQKLTDKTVFDLANLIYGDQARSRLGGGDRIDCSYDIKHRVETEHGESVELYRWRVNMISCNRASRLSLTITMRAIPGTPPAAEGFGIPAEILDVIGNTDLGMAVIVGPTGSGKTTLMAAALREKLMNPDNHRNLVTIEQPIEFIYDQLNMPSSFVTQLEVGRHVSGFSEGIENAMRMAPTDILLGESRSYDTMSSAIQGAMTGHFVLTTLHANSVPETLQRIKNLYPESLQHTAIPEALQAMRLGCSQRLIPAADGGRVAIREYLVIDQDFRNRLAREDDPILAAFKLVEDHGQPMIEDIERCYREGLITEKEYQHQKYNYQSMKESLG